MHINPLRHGLTSQHLILPGESIEAFEALHADMLAHFEPATPIEEALVAKLAESEWRLTRARRVETATLNYLINKIVEAESVSAEEALGLVFLRHGKDIERIRRYETTIARAEAKQRAELDQLLKARYRMEMLDSSSEPRNSAGDYPDNEPTSDLGSASQNVPTPSEPFQGCSSIPVQKRPAKH